MSEVHDEFSKNFFKRYILQNPHAVYSVHNNSLVQNFLICIWRTQSFSLISSLICFAISTIFSNLKLLKFQRTIELFHPRTGTAERTALPSGIVSTLRVLKFAHDTAIFIKPTKRAVNILVVLLQNYGGATCVIKKI